MFFFMLEKVSTQNFHGAKKCQSFIKMKRTAKKYGEYL